MMSEVASLLGRSRLQQQEGERIKSDVDLRKKGLGAVEAFGQGGRQSEGYEKDRDGLPEIKFATAPGAKLPWDCIKTLKVVIS